MKKIIAVCLIAALLSSCHHNHDDMYQAQGTLTGFDVATCVCCGGMILKIDNDAANYRIFSLPSVSDHDWVTMHLPRRIKFDYTVRTTGGCAIMKWVDITRFEFE